MVRLIRGSTSLKVTSAVSSSETAAPSSSRPLAVTVSVWVSPALPCASAVKLQL